jgi:hypothetical protein
MALHVIRIPRYPLQPPGRSGLFCAADFPVCCLAGFPTRRRHVQRTRPAHGRPADWEIGDAAGLETCGTSPQAAYQVQPWPPPSGPLPPPIFFDVISCCFMLFTAFFAKAVCYFMLFLGVSVVFRPGLSSLVSLPSFSWISLDSAGLAWTSCPKVGQASSLSHLPFPRRFQRSAPVPGAAFRALAENSLCTRTF